MTYIWIIAFILALAFFVWGGILLQTRNNGHVQGILAGYCMVIGLFALLLDGLFRLV